MIAAKRLLEVQAKEHGLLTPKNKKVSFMAYFESEVEKRKNIDVDLSSWQSTLKHLRIFIGNDLVNIHDIDEGWLERFKEHLLYNAYKSNGEKISNNSAHH